MVLPYKFKVVDIPSLNRWTEDHYLPTVFRQDPVYDPIPGRVAHHNQMVTGAWSQILVKWSSPQPEKVWWLTIIERVLFMYSVFLLVITCHSPL